jgi:hypothetical protein
MRITIAKSGLYIDVWFRFRADADAWATKFNTDRPLQYQSGWFIKFDRAEFAALPAAALAGALHEASTVK